MPRNTQAIHALLIEDNPSHAAIVSRHLRSIADRQVTVTHVSTLAEGIDKARDLSPDVVLLDLGLPDGTPETTLDRFIESNSDVPVIVVTSQDDIDRAIDAVKRGAQDELPKTTLSPEVLARSITYAIERKRSQQQLQRYAIELERSNHEFQQFAHVAAHELKSPMWSVSLGCELLLEKHRAELDSESQEVLDGMVTAIHQMTTLINDLLEFARVESQAKPPQEVNSESVLADVQSALAGVIKEAGAEVTHDPMPSLWADPTQVRLLLQNLIGNAVKYREERKPKIHVHAERAGRYWQISVQDNGIGIPKASLRKVFGLFERVHDRNKYSGTGLGLAICKRIVDRHQGRIWVESEEGKGSTFFFTLPAEPLQATRDREVA